MVLTLDRPARTIVVLTMALAAFDGACTKRPRMAAIAVPAIQGVPAADAAAKLPEPPAPETSPPPANSKPIGIPTQPAAVPAPPAPPPSPRVHRRQRKLPKTATLTASVAAQPAPNPEAAGAPMSSPVAAGPALTTGPASLPLAADVSPRLAEVLTPDQERAYNLSIERDLESARKQIKVFGSRQLSDLQQDVVHQVEIFIRQAEELRKTDLAEAKGLAHKASVLARDLAETPR